MLHAIKASCQANDVFMKTTWDQYENMEYAFQDSLYNKDDTVLVYISREKKIRGNRKSLKNFYFTNSNSMKNRRCLFD